MTLTLSAPFAHCSRQAFVGEFADAFIDDTELEGGPPASSLRVLTQVRATHGEGYSASQLICPVQMTEDVLNNHSEWLTLFSPADQTRLRRVIALQKEGYEWYCKVRLWQPVSWGHSRNVHAIVSPDAEHEH